MVTLKTTNKNLLVMDEDDCKIGRYYDSIVKSLTFWNGLEKVKFCHRLLDAIYNCFENIPRRIVLLYCY